MVGEGLFKDLPVLTLRAFIFVCMKLLTANFTKCMTPDHTIESLFHIYMRFIGIMKENKSDKSNIKRKEKNLYVVNQLSYICYVLFFYHLFKVK